MGSKTENNLQSLTKFVSEEQFNEIIDTFLKKRHEKEKPLWTSERIEDAIRIIEQYNEAPLLKLQRTHQQYHYGKKYDIIEEGTNKSLILKRKSESDPVVRIVPTVNFYNILLEIHLMTGHGGRDKMLYNLKPKYVIPTSVVLEFLKLCTVCQSKRKARKGTAICSIGSSNFNHCGQVDIDKYNIRLSAPLEETKSEETSKKFVFEKRDDGNFHYYQVNSENITENEENLQDSSEYTQVPDFLSVSYENNEMINPKVEAIEEDPISQDSESINHFMDDNHINDNHLNDNYLNDTYSNDSHHINIKRQKLMDETLNPQTQQNQNQYESKNSDDEFDSFGKLVASQLRNLPLDLALMCEDKILALIRTERINQLNKAGSSK